MPRLFVAVWPPDDVMATLRAVPRNRSGVRWTTEDQWHVTLRFFGTVDEADVPAIDAALAGAASGCAAPSVTLAPPVRRLGSALALTVDGLDEVATAVIDATTGFGEPPQHRRFRGHLTIGRLKSRRGSTLTRVNLAPQTWKTSEIALVRSHLGQGPGRASRYETIGMYQLA